MASGHFTLSLPLCSGGWELQKREIHGTGKKRKKSCKVTRENLGMALSADNAMLGLSVSISKGI